MKSFTLSPGSCPPSPGLAPCAIFIWISVALDKYSVVTPNLPEATCLIREFIESPLGKGLNLEDSSPPSPVLDLPPRRFIAIASVVCASVDIEPSDIAPVANLFTISGLSAINKCPETKAAELTMGLRSTIKGLMDRSTWANMASLQRAYVLLPLLEEHRLAFGWRKRRSCAAGATG